MTHKNVRKNARIDEHILDLFFEGRLNPSRAPRPSAPYHPSASPWLVQRAVIAEHQMHAAAARQQARYDVEAASVAEYHDAEVARLEAELSAGRSRAGRRRNPTRAAYAHDADFDEVDDWVTIEECDCHTCAPARMNPRAAKRAAAAAATGAYADLDSVTLVIENALANYGLSMNNILAVKFTRGGKSRGGACSYSRSLNKCQIMFNGLAWPAFTEEQRLNTVLHEAAHAIQFLTTGTSDHGPKWQKIARSIGCSGDSCMTLEASQAMVDAYAEAKGLEKRKIITREDAEAARSDFAVGDYVSFDHKRERWFGKIVSRGPMHATVMIQSPREGITGKIPYPSLQKEAPPRFAEKVAGVDKPAPGESLSAWQARTGRGRENPEPKEDVVILRGRRVLVEKQATKVYARLDGWSSTPHRYGKKKDFVVVLDESEDAGTLRSRVLTDPHPTRKAALAEAERTLELLEEVDKEKQRENPASLVTAGSLGLKKIHNDLYQSPDERFRIVRVFHQHDGSEWWYWRDEVKNEGGDDLFKRKWEVVEALEDYMKHGLR